MRVITEESIALLLIGGIAIASGCTRDIETAPAATDGTTLMSEPDAAKPRGVLLDAAAKYDGKIVHQPDAGRGKDDGWFLVQDGKRRWITEATWLEANGYKATDVIYISSEEFNAIPEDPRPLPETGNDAAPPTSEGGNASEER